jgi:hypothetical protein
MVHSCSGKTGPLDWMTSGTEGNKSNRGAVTANDGKQFEIAIQHQDMKAFVDSDEPVALFPVQEALGKLFSA